MRGDEGDVSPAWGACEGAAPPLQELQGRLTSRAETGGRFDSSRQLHTIGPSVEGTATQAPAEFLGNRHPTWLPDPAPR